MTSKSFPDFDLDIDEMMAEIDSRSESEQGEKSGIESISKNLPDDAIVKDEVNILREKTFNRELRNLVGRIKDNEPIEISSEHEIDFKDIDTCSEDELLVRLHRLFYMTKNLQDNREINISFNLFDLQNEIDLNGLDKALTEYITEELKRLNFSSFALLSYSLEKKGYVPTINNIEDIYADNIIIGLRGRLFTEIFKSPGGIILNSETIENDPFLKKIFSTIDSRKSISIYFILLSKLTSILRNEMDISDDACIQPFIPSSILMIELDSDLSENYDEYISKTVAQRLSIPLYLFDNDHLEIIESANSENPDKTISVLDYMLTLFLLKDDGIGIIIKSIGKDKRIVSFMMKYMILKFNRLMASDSVIIHISENRLVIITDKSLLDPINTIIDEYNELFDDIFSIKLFSNKDFDITETIIKEIILSK